MPSIKTALIVLIPVIGLSIQVLQPKLQLMGIGAGEVTGLNNEGCVEIPELQGCEDAWISPENGQAYLVCTPLSARAAWLPAILHVNASALPLVSEDYLAVYDFPTQKHKKLSLVGMPSHAQHNLNLHAIDVYQSPADREHLTVFVNSHRPPVDRSSSGVEGATSVIEIFETRIGSSELQWVRTVEHPLIRTPNNLVAMGPRSFYVSNDHRRKIHWSRAWKLVYNELSDIIYCDASSTSSTSSAHCIVAADGVLHPNGIAKGPKDLLYSVSSSEGKLSIWEAQSGDHSLVPVDTVALPRLSDNVHVGPDGAIYIASFPRPLQLLKHFGSAGVEKSPVEVYRVTNETSQAQFYGNKYKVDRVFGDDGTRVSGTTTAAPYKDKLLLTGVMSDKVAICDLA